MEESGIGNRLDPNDTRTDEEIMRDVQDHDIKAATNIFKEIARSRKKHQQIREKYELDNTLVNPGLTEESMNDAPITL